MNLQRLGFSFQIGMLVVPAFAGLLLFAELPVLAQGTHLWTQSRFEEFEKGTSDGVEITSDGKLRRGPQSQELLTTPSTFVWAVAGDQKKPDLAYVATGSPATVLRVGLDGKKADGSGVPKPDKLFETKALAVQVLKVGPDGMLYAATIPDGKVYRLKPDASEALDETKAEVVFDLTAAQKKAEEKAGAAGKAGEASGKDGAASDAKKPDRPESAARYIWDLTFDSAGRLYVATGGPGAVYRVDVTKQNAPVESFFESDEQHIRALVWDRADKFGNAADGKANLIAGSDGSGLVYRISPDGKGYVLFSAPRREVTALAVGADGTIFESDVGDKSHNPLPAIPVQAGGSSITINFVSPGSVQAANASTALPEGSEIFALTPNAAPRKVWSGKDEVVYRLVAGGFDSKSDGVTALTGNRGRVLRIHADGSFGDVAHLDAQQAVAMAEVSGGWLVGTANTGKLFRFDSAMNTARDSGTGDHAYASDILDAGAAARWGRIEVEPGSRGFQILTRSGNVEQPVRRAKDWGWSEWQAAPDGKVASPVGRYLQWKVELAAYGVVGGVGVNYLAVNAAPEVDDVLVVPGAKFVPQPPPTQVPTVTIAFPSANGGVVLDTSNANASMPIQAQKDRTAVTVRWNAHDDNGDEMSYDIYLRGDGEANWWPLKKGVTERVYSFDGSTLPDGGYEAKVVASDAPSHTPGDALTGELTSERFELDTTAPVISALKARAAGRTECSGTPCRSETLIPISFDAVDATSPISRAEYSIDSGKWQYVEPVGQLSDSKTEHYSFDARVLLKLEDSNGNDEVIVREAAREHLVTVRVYDRHENVATAKIIVPADATKPATSGAK